MVLPRGPHREETVHCQGRRSDLAKGTAFLALCCRRKPTVQKVRRPWGESGELTFPRDSKQQDFLAWDDYFLTLRGQICFLLFLTV